MSTKGLSMGSIMAQLRENAHGWMHIEYIAKSGQKMYTGVAYNEEDQDKLNRGLIFFRSSDNYEHTFYLRAIGIVKIKLENKRLDSKYGRYPDSTPAAKKQTAKAFSPTINGHMWRVSFLNKTENPDRPYDFLGSITILAGTRREMGLKALEIAKVGGLGASHLSIAYKGMYDSEHVSPRFVLPSSEDSIHEIGIEENEDLKRLPIYRAAIHQTHGVFVGSILCRGASNSDAVHKARTISGICGVPCMLHTASEFRSGADEANKDFNELLNAFTREVIA